MADAELTCACGCGTPICPGMYVYEIGPRLFAQKCVRLVPLRTRHADDPLTGIPTQPTAAPSGVTIDTDTALPRQTQRS